MSDTRKCPNCRQEISQTGYEVHESRCWRFTTYCSLCDEPVATVELESHNEEYHTSKPCGQCGLSVAPTQTEQHLEECLEGMVLCKYCDLEKKRKDYSEHVEACGSRTEVCEKCSVRVRLKDMQEHLDMKCGHVRSEPPLDQHTLANLYSFDSYTGSNFAPPSPPYTINPPFHPRASNPPSHAPTNGTELDEQWVESVGGVCADELDSLVAQNMFYLNATQSEPFPPHSPPASPPATDADFELARRLQEEEERRDRAFEMDQNLAKQLQEENSYPFHSPSSPPTYRGSSQRTQDKEKNRQFRSDQFVPQLQPENFTVYHTPHTPHTPHIPHTPHASTTLPSEAMMGSSVSGDEEFARKLQLEEDKLQYSISRHSLHSQSHTRHAHSPPPTPDDSLPCQFCEQLFPAHRLTLHQNSCSEEREGGLVDKDHGTGKEAMRKCVYCEILVPELDCSVHEALCEKNPDAHLSNAYPVPLPFPTTPSPPTPSHIETSDIPCETCGELFSLTDIHKHQAVCSLKTSHMSRGKTPSQTSSSAVRPSHLPQGNPRAEQSRGRRRANRKLAIKFPEESGLCVSGRAVLSKKPNGHTHT